MSDPWRQLIPPEKLHPNPDNPREDFDKTYIKELSESIRVNGLKHPLLVYADPANTGHYLIEDGECRWMAMKEWSTGIPAIIQPSLSGESRSIRNITTALITGIHRRDLNPIERAHGFQRLVMELGTQARVSEHTGISPAAIANSLALLELSLDTQERVRARKLSPTEALRLVRRHRAAKRRKKGHGQPGAQWEPDHFNTNHPLARKAAALCDARGHTQYRRRGGACDLCWETTIRADQDTVTRSTLSEAAAWRSLQATAGTQDEVEKAR